MCGIVGLFFKDQARAPELGALLAEMLVSMSDRGPDSAGIALYDASEGGQEKLTVQCADARALDQLSQHYGPDVVQIDTHAVIAVSPGQSSEMRTQLASELPDLQVMSAGTAIEIYKEVGRPAEVAARFNIASRAGSHGIGHTRMATESAVTTNGAHPFSTGPDQCLVHNGSLSNHNALRRRLRRAGVAIETENDSEVAAAYLTWRMGQGASLGEALEAGLRDLDGFFTFVVGTADGFGVLRDPIACKPAVLAETDDWVAFGSEYRALVGLPGIDTAQVWEPEPATVYFWSHTS